jgi:hypothetical protein
MPFVMDRARLIGMGPPVPYLQTCRQPIIARNKSQCSLLARIVISRGCSNFFCYPEMSGLIDFVQETACLDPELTLQSSRLERQGWVVSRSCPY